MIRFTKEDKKVIAKAQKQEVFETNDWTGERRLVGYRCKKCKRELPLDILEVDHIKPRALGGSDRPSNLQLLCPPCNKKKGPRLRATRTKTPAKSRVKKTLKSIRAKATRTRTPAKSHTKKASTKTKAKTTRSRK